MTEKEKIVLEFVLEENRKACELYNKMLDEHRRYRRTESKAFFGLKYRSSDRQKVKGAIQQTERFLKVLTVAFAENTTSETIRRLRRGS